MGEQIYYSNAYNTIIQSELYHFYPITENIIEKAKNKRNQPKGQFLLNGAGDRT